MKFYNYPKKSLGQNFLIDKNIIKKIIEIGREEINKHKIFVKFGCYEDNFNKPTT